MKSLKITILIASFAVMGSATSVRAEMVTKDEALKVASNWIEVIIQKKGGWGDAGAASVTDVQEFKRGERTIGYFCNVEPVGFIVVSLRKELAPVKAYSANSDIDPHTEGADLLKERMERILSLIQRRFGPVESVRSEDVRGLLEIDYRPMWDALEAGVPTVEKLAGPAEATAYVQRGNYQEGEMLLEARWDQGSPYNLFCPRPPDGSTCESERCAVGCNATAGAMVLHHWCWPPYGEGEPYDDEYQWWYMPNQVFDSSPLAQKVAVAELSYEVGVAGQSDYCVVGCATGSHIELMKLGYVDHFRYNAGCWVPYRVNYTTSGWFNVIKEQLNKNRPMTYGIEGHAIVCDGWQVVGSLMQFHMVWGHGTSSATKWYTLDVDWLYDPDEHLLAEHYPVQSVGSTVVSGTYPKNALPYWYFDQDATAYFATTFASGNYLQFLRRIRLKATGHVRIESTATQNTRIFSRGNPSKGIRIRNGTIVLYSGGSMKLH